MYVILSMGTPPPNVKTVPMLKRANALANQLAFNAFSMKYIGPARYLPLGVFVLNLIANVELTILRGATKIPITQIQNNIPTPPKLRAIAEPSTAPNKIEDADPA